MFHPIFWNKITFISNNGCWFSNVCGWLFYSKQTSIETDKGYIWEYTFTMPVDEATLEFKAEGGI